MKPKIMNMLIAIGGLLLCTNAFAHDFEVDGIFYNIKSSSPKSVEVTYSGSSYNSSSEYWGSVVIPSTVTFYGTTYSVTSIGKEAFRDCRGFTSVTIPNSVTSIGASAFYGCFALTSVTIPNSVTSIGKSAFLDCSGLTSVTIPNSVTSIGDSAFCACSGLTEVTIGESVTSIGSRAFSYCSGLTEVTIPNSVTSIGEEAFWDCTGLTSVTIGNSVTSIGYLAFGYCFSLTTITIGNSVTSIGNGAFSQCSGLTSVTIPNSVTSIGSSAFSGCSGLTSVTIGNSVTSIGSSAFSGCSGLTSVTIGNSVTSIGSYAFEGCSGLKSVTIPNSVTYIGESAFYYCSGLMSITIPNSVTSIGTFAFYFCSGLTSVTIGNSVTEIGESAFNRCSGLKSVTIGNSVTSIGDYAFYLCTGLTELIIADGTEYLSLGKNGSSEDLFSDCPLEKLYLGRNLRYGYSPFSYKTTLKEVTIGNSVTSIGDYAFEGCSGLTELIIADGTESFSLGYNELNKGLFSDCPLEKLYLGRNLRNGYSPFSYKTTLNEVTIGNSVTSIGDYAFNGCTGLIELIIADGTKTLSLGCNYNGLNFNSAGKGLFYDCPLKKLYLGRNLSYKTDRSYGYSPFHSITTLKEVTISNSVTGIGARAFEYCSGLTSVTIGNSVTWIGYYAFIGCSDLTSVTIPNSVTQIGEWAFVGTDWYNNQSNGILYLDNCCLGYKGVLPTGELSLKDGTRLIGATAFEDCSGLTSVAIPNSVTSIGDSAFEGCSGLTSVSIPNSVTSIGGSAFEGCSGLTSVTIGNSVTSIGDYAFEGCSGLTEVNITDLSAWCKIGFGNLYANPLWSAGHLKLNGTEITNLLIPDDITEIKSYAFYGCSGLTSVTIGNSVTSIGQYAFYNCSGLTEVTIGNSVTVIGTDAFSDCTAMTKLYSKAIVPPTCDGYKVFEGVDKENCVLYVPSASIVRYKAASKWKDFYNIKDIESGVEEVFVDGEDYSSAPIEIFNLSGLKVGDSTENLAPGVYIKRQGRKVEKIAIQ